MLSAFITFTRAGNRRKFNTYFSSFQELLRKIYKTCLPLYFLYTDLYTDSIEYFTLRKVEVNYRGVNMIVHCNNKFSPNEVMFLKDNEMFNHRRIEIGDCPICNKFIVRLVETRNKDGKIFDSTYNDDRGMATRTLKEYHDEVLYSTLNLSRSNKGLYGFVYGENIEKVDKKTGEKFVVVKRCDFYNNKEEIDFYSE